jgi:GPH family glycoside/pentoside/hexuronide:cation symporter
MENKKIASNKILWIFAVGQLGWSTLAGIITNWLVKFYEPDKLPEGHSYFIPQGRIVLGLLTAMGVIAAAGRIFDAVTDPYIAGKSDGFKHRLGRRIPFMRVAAIPFGVMTVLIFTLPFKGESYGNFGLLFLFCMLFYLCMTAYCTPYNALIPELGRTQKTRINLSTYISVTYFFGSGISYLVPNIAGIFSGAMGYTNSFRLTVGILSAIAVVCMLVPAFLIDENAYADTTPTNGTAFGSLMATFRNGDFRTFVASDIFYWIGLTMFQTGLPFYITTLLGLKETWAFPMFAAMTFFSLLCYAPVNIFAKKMGKKKLIAFAFMFFSVTFLVTALAGILPIPGVAYGFIIAALAAVPMAILGILPQAVVADISEADKIETGESRQGMFYAARTFAFKMGQSLAMLLFTSIKTINSDVPSSESGYGLGLRITAILATVLCLIGGLIFFRYNEKDVIAKLESANKED